MATNNETAGTRAKRFWLMVVIAIVLLGMVSCALGIRSFFQEDRNPVTRLMAAKSAPATRLEIDATVTSTDPGRGVMKVELVFHPFGEILGADHRVVSREIHILTDAVGKSDIILKTNHRPQPVELTLSLLDGDIALYPIDRYKANLEFDAYMDRGADNETPLPLVVNFLSHNHLLHAEAALAADSADSDINVEISLTRPLTIKAFAWFMVGVMLLIGISATMVTYNVAYRGRKLEAGLMIWMGALLFVLPGIRGMLPGVPPLGSFIDYLVFFWVEASTAVCLFIMVLAWYGRALPEK